MRHVKLLPVLCMVLVTFNVANAQVHMNGVQHLELRAGGYDSFEDSGYHVGVYYSKVRNNKWWWRLGVQANKEEIVLENLIIPVEKYLVCGTYFFTLGSLFNHNLYFNAGLGGVAGYERINDGDNQVNESIQLTDKSKPVIGLRPEVNAEIFLSSKFIFTLSYGKRALFNSDIGIWDDIYSSGLKFYFH